MKKWICILLCIAVLVPTASCAPRKLENGAGELELVGNGASPYTVVYPENARPEDTLAVFAFLDAFRKATGIELPAKNDLLENDGIGDADAHRILIGKTVYPGSESAFKGLKYQEYQIVVGETDVAIAAYTSSGYNAAIQWLCDHVFDHFAEGTLTMGREGYRESLVTGYQVSSWTIAGVSLEHYRIVYADRKYEKELNDIVNKLAVRTGYRLDLVLDFETEPSPYEILIGDTNRPESAAVETPAALHYTFRTVNRKLVAKAGGKQSHIRLLEEFADIITKDASVITMGDSYMLNGNFLDDPCNRSVAEGTDVRIMSANLMAERSGYAEAAIRSNFDFSRRTEILFSALEFYAPTVVGFQECCLQWRTAIKGYQGYEKQWQLLEFDNPNLPNDPDNKVYNTILFRKDLYDLMDCGMEYYSEYDNVRCRCYAWAILKEKTTGRKFCFVSTHWTGGNGEINGETAFTIRQVAELTAFVNEMVLTYPVFTTGDFNRNEYTNAIKTFLADTNSADCMYAAKKRLNVAGSWHDWGNPTPSAGSADHITATKNGAEVLQFETLTYNEQIWASDHAWLMADVKLK